MARCGMAPQMARDAWTNYWARGYRGCVPGCSSIGSVQTRLWAEFAEGLPRKARVLDLGTGDGAVLSELSRSRGDLKLTGVDSASSLPAPKKPFKLLAGVQMERLPFAERRFEAVCSQFGFEYGACDLVAPEIARVLLGGGRFQLLIHHRASPVVAQGQLRRAALHWAVAESGWFEKARNLLEARRSMRLATPPAFADAVAAARKVVAEPVAAEVIAAVHQIVQQGEREPPPGALQRLSRLAADVHEEIARLDALDQAARDRGEIAEIEKLLTGACLTVESPTEVIEPSTGAAFAWLVRGSRARP